MKVTPPQNYRVVPDSGLPQKPHSQIYRTLPAVVVKQQQQQQEAKPRPTTTIDLLDGSSSSGAKATRAPGPVCLNTCKKVWITWPLPHTPPPAPPSFLPLHACLLPKPRIQPIHAPPSPPPLPSALHMHACMAALSPPATHTHMHMHAPPHSLVHACPCSHCPALLAHTTTPKLG